MVRNRPSDLASVCLRVLARIADLLPVGAYIKRNEHFMFRHLDIEATIPELVDESSSNNTEVILLCRAHL